MLASVSVVLLPESNAGLITDHLPPLECKPNIKPTLTLNIDLTLARIIIVIVILTLTLTLTLTLMKALGQVLLEQYIKSPPSWHTKQSRSMGGCLLRLDAGTFGQGEE